MWISICFRFNEIAIAIAIAIANGIVSSFISKHFTFDESKRFYYGYIGSAHKRMKMIRRWCKQVWKRERELGENQVGSRRRRSRERTSKQEKNRWKNGVEAKNQTNKKKNTELILIKVFVYVAVSLLTSNLTRRHYAYQLYCWFDKKPIRRWINCHFEAAHMSESNTRQTNERRKKASNKRGKKERNS